MNKIAIRVRCKGDREKVLEMAKRAGWFTIDDYPSTTFYEFPENFQNSKFPIMGWTQDDLTYYRKAGYIIRNADDPRVVSYFTNREWEEKPKPEWEMNENFRGGGIKAKVGTVFLETRYSNFTGTDLDQIRRALDIADPAPNGEVDITNEVLRNDNKALRAALAALNAKPGLNQHDADMIRNAIKCLNEFQDAHLPFAQVRHNLSKLLEKQ